jgi:hypothetical protein
MKLLALFLLRGLHQKPDGKSYFSQRKILETPCIWTCSVRGFTFYSRFFILLTTKRVNVMKQGTTAKTVGWSFVLIFPASPYGSQLLEMWKRIEVQQVAMKSLNVRF